MPTSRRPMRTYTGLLVCLVAAGCQKPVPSAPEAREMAQQTEAVEIPQLTIVDPHRELGLLLTGKQTVEFELANSGQSPLTIDHLEKSCGCVDVELSKSELPPGDTAKLSIVIHPRQSEDRAATVRVHSNDPFTPQLITVKWQARGAVDVSPQTLDFGAIRPGTESMRELKVARAGQGLDCEIAVRTHPQDEVTAVRKKSSDATTDVDLWEVRVKASPLPGSYQGQVHFSFASCDQVSFAVPVYWNSRNIVDVVPSSLFLGTVSPQSVIHGELQVMGEENQAIRVKEFHWKMGGLSLNTEYLSAAAHQGTVVLSGMAPALGIHRDQLEIVFLTPEEVRVEVPVVLVVR